MAKKTARTSSTTPATSPARRTRATPLPDESGTPATPAPAGTAHDLQSGAGGGAAAVDPTRLQADLDAVPELPPAGGTTHAEANIAGIATGETQSVSATPEGADTDTAARRERPSREEVARRAYFRFLERGGTPGREDEDWLEAERELRERR